MISRNAAIIKSRIYGPDGAAPSNIAPMPEEQFGAFSTSGGLIPPYDPGTMCLIVENCFPLGPCIEAYVTNIEAFGHRLEPVIDLTAPSANDQIEDVILLEKTNDDPTTPQGVTADEVQERRAYIERKARIERLQIELFFQHCSGLAGGFIELRKLTRRDLETTGNAYWEVICNRIGDVTQVTHVPSVSVRLLREDTFFTTVEMPQRVSAISYRMVKMRVKFRRFVQLVNGVETVYFKEFGDPRTVSARTGSPYASLDELHRVEGPNAVAATEMKHFSIPSPRSVYGIPRWINAMIAALGSRASEDVNYDYFNHNAIPPFVFMVSGASLAKDAITRLEQYLADKVRAAAAGKRFWKPMIIEAEPSANTPVAGRIRIEIKPLTGDLPQDGLFQTYQKNCAERVGQTFRLPRMLRGDSGEINRSVAEASLLTTEMQVFSPERATIDNWVNDVLFPRMQVNFWRFASNAPKMTDPSMLTEIVAKLVNADMLNINEGRAVAADILNKPFDALPYAWAKQPMKLTMAAMQAQAPIDMTTAPVVAPPSDGVPPVIASDLDGAPAQSSPEAIVEEQLSRLRDVLQARGVASAPGGEAALDDLLAGFRQALMAPSRGAQTEDPYAPKGPLAQVLVNKIVECAAEDHTPADQADVIRLPAEEFAALVTPTAVPHVEHAT